MTTTDEKSHLSGVRVVAVFEGIKAFLILIAGMGALSLLNRDAERYAQLLIFHLHLNPLHKYPQIFLEAAKHVTNTHLWFVASMALTDAVLRSALAYGLWFDLRWGVWLGVILGGLFIPLEVYELLRHVTWFKCVAFLVNIAVVAYLAREAMHPKQPKA